MVARLLGKLTKGCVRRILSICNETLRHAPRPVVLLCPEWTTGMAQQHFELAPLPPIEQNPGAAGSRRVQSGSGGGSGGGGGGSGSSETIGL